MKRLLPLALTVLLLALVAVSAARNGALYSAAASSPQGAAQRFLGYLQAQDYDHAFAMISPDSGITLDTFRNDVSGSHGSLKTISTLESYDTKVMQQSGDAASVRALLKWSTAVGAIAETRDLNLKNSGGKWQLLWPAPAQPEEVRTVKTDYLRWDIVQRGDSRDDWGAQNVEPPRMRIVSMNAIEKDGSVIVMGEVVNEDTVPGFITVNATLIDKQDKPFAEESSFDKISHTLLPREVSPFRIDFPGHKLAEVKSVRMNPTTLLVPAYADPVVGVARQRIEKDANGHGVLRGELVNQSGRPVNIPHVLATYYDNAGRVIWVSDGYVNTALLPGQAVPFAVELRDDVAGSVQSYRVTVNHYSADRT